MEDTALEKERRRQRIARKRRRRRILMMQRIAVLVIGLLLVIGLFKAIKGIFQDKPEGKAVEAAASKAQDTSSSKVKDADAKNADVQADNVQPMSSEEMGKGNLVLVNEDYPLRAYDDIKLESVLSYNEGLYKVRSEETKLQPEALEAFNHMIKDFVTQKGDSDIGVISGYRNFEDQERLHFESLGKKTSEDTDAFVAKPDRSEHHTGLAIDLGIYHADGTSSEYDGTGIYSWINENCYKYGFVVRYQEDKKDKTGIGYEPWHLRYVGVLHAGLMQKLHLCLEEYIEYLKIYRYYTNPLQPSEDDLNNYSIYYVPATGDLTKVPVPTSKKYEISGNNKDGFIVTVTLH